MFEKIIKRDSLIIFILTVAAFGAAIFYESAYLHQFGVPFSLQIVSPTSLIVSAFIILVLSGSVFYVKVKIYDRAKFSKNNDIVKSYLLTRIVYLSAIFAWTLVYLMTGFIDEESLKYGEIINNSNMFFGILIAASVLIEVVRFMIYFIPFLRLKNKSTFLSYLNKNMKKSEPYQYVFPIWMALLAPIVMLYVVPSALGVSTAKNLNQRNVLTSQDPNIEKVVIYQQDDRYFIKEYDKKQHKYLDGYYQVSVVDQKLHPLNLE